MRLDDVLTGIGAEPLAASDPRQIGSFPIRAVLGSGGMGRVYLGIAPTGYVAVKRVRPDLAKDAKFLDRFGQELNNQGFLPAGVSPRLLATDRTAQPPWFATEYVPGVTLDRALDILGGHLPVPDCWILLRELATRLHALANAGMVHRDLKPSNIMLTADGVTLIDFGLSRTTLQTSLTTVDRTVGTPPFMAPEQLKVPRMTPTPAVDVFALGGVITYAATGEPPFGYDPAVGYRIEHHEPHLDALLEADPELAAVVASCLTKNPEDRPAAASLSRLRPAARTPSWPAPLTDLIRLRSDIPFQPDIIGPACETSPTASATAPPIDTGSTSLATGSTGLVTGPTSPGTGPSRPGSHRRRSRRSEKRQRRKLLLVAIPLVIVVGGGITALSLSPLLQPRPKTTTVASPSTASTATHPHPSATKTKPGPALTTPAPAPTQAAVVPAQAPRGASVVSYTSDDMIENKADRLCLADSGNWTAESLSCTGASLLGWKAVREPGNKFELVDQSYGDCATDYGQMVQVAPCTSTQSVTTFWRVGITGSGGAMLVDDATGQCMTSADTSGSSGFSTDTCNPSDPRQLWFDAGKTL